MNRQFSNARYVSSVVEDVAEGFGGFELTRHRAGKEECVAKIIYWDAMGRFFVQTFDELPLEVLEELIQEARTSIRTR